MTTLPSPWTSPEEANAARVAAEVQKDAAYGAYQRAVAVGAPASKLLELAERYRMAELQALEAAVAIGAHVLEAGASDGSSQVETPQQRPRGRKAVIEGLSTNLGLHTRTVEKFAQLARFRRDHPDLWKAHIRERHEKGEPVTQKGLIAAAPKKPRRPSGKSTVGETQVAARIDAELLALVDDMAKRTKTDRAEVARRALEVYLRPEASDAHEVLQRALLPLTFERRLLAKVELAADEATYCAGKFGGRPWKAIARALEGARAEALQLAGVEDDGMELEP